MNFAIILSGGHGSRMNMTTPKQYLDVCGKPIILYALEAFQKNDFIDKIFIASKKEWERKIKNLCDKYYITKFSGFSPAGRTRQESIRNTLDFIKKNTSELDENDSVIIHDAARPLISQELINDCIQNIENYDGVIPVLPMKDTVYISENGYCITKLIQREKIFAGQAPEYFKFNKYYNANYFLSEEEFLKINGSTEIAIKFGLKIKMIKGNEMNFKITTNADFERLKEILEKN